MGCDIEAVVRPEQTIGSKGVENTNRFSVNMMCRGTKTIVETVVRGASAKNAELFANLLNKTLDGHFRRMADSFCRDNSEEDALEGFQMLTCAEDGKEMLRVWPRLKGKPGKVELSITDPKNNNVAGVVIDKEKLYDVIFGGCG